MTEPWTYAGEVARTDAGVGAVTLVEGTTFCLSSGNGDIGTGTSHGLFFLDRRFLSTFELRINEAPVEGLAVAVDEPFTAAFFGRCPTEGMADSGLVVFRRRYVGAGMREEIVVRNYAPIAARLAVELAYGVDFGGLFEVKESRVPHRDPGPVTATAAEVRLRDGDGTREVVVAFTVPADDVAADRARWRPTVEPGAEWSVCVQVSANVAGAPVPPHYRCGEAVDTSTPTERFEAWRRSVPSVRTDDARLRDAVRRAAEDLGALRIFDPDHPDLPVVAAGAPWFMTLFGRDSLLTSWMALIVDPELARGVLETLARFQGTRTDAATDEQPGRILHEIRAGQSTSGALGDGTVYYGSADSTPLFVMLLGELRRWGLGEDVVQRLLPNVDRALEWITTAGDRDGDGYVEYERATREGLANQGWKDSWDGIRFADGHLPDPPIALCEVQGYAYAAYIARAHFAHEAGDTAAWDHWRTRAAELKEAFNRDFWLPDRGWFAIGLDRDKRPIDSLASNMGHCLWTGIVDEDKAASVAAHLVGPDLFSGWGIRTLARSMGGYNPVSYHCGSVWPHDNAIIAAGLIRYGFVDEAHTIIDAMLDAAAANGGRLPELFSGLGRDELSVPAPYPTSCVPQAWAAATPLLFLRLLLRFDPWVPHGQLWLAPVPLPTMHDLCVDRIPLDGYRVSVEVADGGAATVDGLPEGVVVVREPRRPLTGHFDDGSA